MTNGGDDRSSLIDRLQRRIDQLQKAQYDLGTPSKDIQDVIDGLRDELNVIKVCFPFLYILPPFKGKQ